MGRGTSDNGCSRILLVVINLIFMVLGLCILGFGIYLKVDPGYSAITNFFNYNLQAEAQKNSSTLMNLESASIAVIVIGAIIAGISIIGIVGACFELKPLIIIYGIIITLLLLGLIAIGVAAIVYKYILNKNFEDEVKKLVIEQLKKEYEGEIAVKNGFTIAADIIQVYLECCGISNYTDFEGQTIWNRTVPGGTAKAPIACCKFNSKQRESILKGQFPKLDNYNCAINPNKDNSNFEIGCLTPMNLYLDRMLLITLIVTIVIGLILIIGTVASCCMCRSM